MRPCAHCTTGDLTAGGGTLRGGTSLDDVQGFALALLLDGTALRGLALRTLAYTDIGDDAEDADELSFTIESITYGNSDVFHRAVWQSNLKLAFAPGAVAGRFGHRRHTHQIVGGIERPDVWLGGNEGLWILAKNFISTG